MLTIERQGFDLCLWHLNYYHSFFSWKDLVSIVNNQNKYIYTHEIYINTSLWLDPHNARVEVFIMPLWFLQESSHSCGILWNPVESFLAGCPAKIAIPGTIYSSGIEPFQIWDQNGPGMDQESGGIQLNRFFIYLFYNYIFYLYFNNICQMYYVFAMSWVDHNHVHQHQHHLMSTHTNNNNDQSQLSKHRCGFFFLFPFLFCLLIII